MTHHGYRRLDLSLTPMIKEMASFLQANKVNIYLFAWTHSDLWGISSAIASHVLNIDPMHVLVKPKRRGMDPERSVSLKEEVMNKLKGNGFIHNALYPKWASNSVLKRKANRKWRTCVNYSDWNKHTLKTAFHFQGSTIWLIHGRIRQI